MTRYGWIPSCLLRPLLTGHEHVHAVCRSTQTRSRTPGEERITLNELRARTTAGRSQRYTGRAHRIYRVSSTHRARGGGRESRLHVSGSIDGPPILQIAGDEPARQRPDETGTQAGEHV